MANGGTCYIGGTANAAGQAACQAQPGAQWVPDAPAQQQQQESTSNPWMTAAQVGLGLASLHPAFRLGKWGAKGAQALYKGSPMKGRIGGMMDKLFRRDSTAAYNKAGQAAAGNPGFVLPGGVSKISRVKGQKGFDYSPAGVQKQTFNTNPLTGGASEATRAMRGMPSRNAMLATGAGVGGAAAMYAGRGGGPEQRALDEKANNAKTLAELMDRQKQIDDAKKNNETPKKELSFAERVKIGLKDKDTVYKLGLLMSELGNNDPNRASKLLEHNNALAKNASSSYTALKNMILSPKELADSIFIDRGGMAIIGWGKMDEGQQKAAAQARGNAINALMHELAMAGKLPTMENAQALFYARNPDKDPRNKEKKPEDEDKDPWYKFFS
jgi:hypothetical protein